MGYFDRISESGGISRRGFVKAGALAAALSTAGLSGCSNQVEKIADTGNAGEQARSAERDLVSGEWVPVACWHNCGGRCLNKALICDGVPIRQKTDDLHEDSWEYPQQRSCVRGHSQRNHVMAADRIKYPMKRKGWSPDNPNGEMRGKDEWERISWEEAYKYIGDELKKVYEECGPRSVWSWGGTFDGGVSNVLNYMGGCVSTTDTLSFGTYCLDTTKLGLPTFDCSPQMNYAYSINDRFDTENADWVIIQGANPVWAGGSMAGFRYMQAKKKGTQFVIVGPSNNLTGQLLDARWICVRNGTDMAFMLAVAYEMLKLDEEKGDIVDWDFLHKYCVGFDSESMPEGAKLEENFKDYVLGNYDGVPKTAEWATKICGTPVDDIRWYAELIGKNNKVMLQHSYSFARAAGAEDVPQMFMTLGAMGGHMGKSGHCCGGTYHMASGDGGGPLITAGLNGYAGPQGQVDDAIPGPTAWKSILDKKYTYVGGLILGPFLPAEERDIDIRVVFFDKGAGLTTGQDATNGIKALRSMDFVFSARIFFNPEAEYSDIVLPVNTLWERFGSVGHHTPFFTGNRETFLVWGKAIESLYESKSDLEIAYGLAESMGLPANEIFPLSAEQMFANQLLGTTIVEPSGESVPLITFTQDDLDAWGVDGEPQVGKIGLAELLEKGVYQVERAPGDSYSYIAYKDFIDDPEGNPLPSESGKFEIYCQWKADTLAGYGFENCDKYKPYPTYIEPIEGYEKTFSDFAKGAKGEFPYVSYEPHYFRRGHSVFDNTPWLREAWTNPVYINAQDAAEKGIEDGDAVCVWNNRGKIVRTACVMESVMPGSIGIPHGSWIDMDETDEYDMAGCENTLTGHELSGMGVSGHSSIIVNFEKFEGGLLTPDCELPARGPKL